MKRKTFEWVVNENGCFNCTSHKVGNHGYSQTSINGKNQTVPRYIYEQCLGEIPSGYVVRHKCDNRLCINIEHLEIGTVKDNQNDMVNRNRQFRPNGELNGYSKLLKSNVQEIKSLLCSGLSCVNISKMFNVSAKTINDIKHGKRWGWLEKVVSQYE